uniref:ATP-dependent Clp protease proteolytic subunit n=1 Tax=Phaeomonas parva TaxID=124430 RepID=A0A7S1XMX6_9STRA
MAGKMLLALAALLPCASAWSASRFTTGTLNAGLYAPSAAGVRGTSGAGSMVMMPIGVPKVAYRVPGSGSADWIDIYNRLYRERIIFVGQEIDDEFANQIIGVLLYLDSEDPDKPIYMYLNCPGGSVIAGMAIYDTMQHIKADVVTINVGISASMASFLLAAGAKGKRLALPHSRVMIHQPMGGAQGQAEDIKVEAAQIMRIRDNLVKMYSMMTGQTQEQVN